MLRIAAAGIRARSQLTVSTHYPLAEPVRNYLRESGVETYVESKADWGTRAVRLAAEGGRVRLLGASAAELGVAVAGSPALSVYSGEVVSAGRVELLTFLREQAVSITTHRFGIPRSYRLGRDHEQATIPATGLQPRSAAAIRG